MNISIEEMRRSIPSSMGREMLTELYGADWNVASTGTIDALGTALGTHPGNLRPRNEDRAVFAQVTSASGERLFVGLVCDGVGGTESGDMAATVAIAACIGELVDTESIGRLDDLLTRTVWSMDEAVRRALNGKGATTASILLASSKRGIAATNIGDSRLFAWTQDERAFRQVSIDDTLENELRNMHGKDISALNARGLRGSLSQALGEVGRASTDLHLSIFGEEDFHRGAVLASDGAWKSSAEGFATIAEHAPSAVDLVRRAVASALWGGGVDNVSIIAIQDIARLLNTANATQIAPFGQRRIEAWFAGMKVVIRDFGGRSGSIQQISEQGSSSEKPANPKKRKAANRPTKKESRTPGRIGQQFELGVEQEDQGDRKQFEGKARIVVSSDDDPPKHSK